MIIEGSQDPFKRQMMEFKQTELKIRIYGNDYSMRMPKVKEYQEFARGLDAESKDGLAEFEKTKNFLVKMGLTGEVVDELELDHMRQIIEVVSGQKKI